jgi:hypothetical protein
MDAIIELILELLGWALPILGKFWFIIVGYLGYKLLGKTSKKMAQGKPKRRLTPVENGGYPVPVQPQEPKTVRASSKYEPIEPESMEGIGVEQEWAFSEPSRSSIERPLHSREDARSSERPESMEHPLEGFDPREGMKWAIIFGEPRAKAPFAPPSARKRNA